MKTNLLLIVEGEKTEKQIIDSFKKHILSSSPNTVTCVFGTDIYQLYAKLSDDEDFDTFGLMRKRDDTLRDFKRDDFSDIYLFFDYDGHATLASDDAIGKMLSFFDNETTVGKLYISYPMVEALRHIPCDDSFNDLTAKCKGNRCQYKTECDEHCDITHYKTIVGRSYVPQLNNIGSYDRTTWSHLICAHLSKMNYLVNDATTFPLEIETQQVIFEKQLRKHINKHCPEVAVLSSFPLFIHDYYGNKRTREMCGVAAR